MGLLSRFFGSRDDVPEWARFFEASSYRAFVAAVQDELERRGLPGEIEDGVVHVRRAGAEPRSYGLQNLAQLCHSEARANWGALVAEHFEKALRSESESEEIAERAKDFEKVRGILKVRLFPEDYGVQVGPGNMVHRVPAAGLMEALVFDLPSSVMTVQPARTQAWGRPAEDLFRLGLENVKSEPKPKMIQQEVKEGAGVGLLLGDSFFTASHALFLEEYLEGGRPFGAVVGMPHRHAVLFHEIKDMRAALAINAMIAIAFGMYQEGPGSISPNLFWWRAPRPGSGQAGGLVHLPSKVTPKEITFSPPDEFVEEVLNRLPAP